MHDSTFVTHVLDLLEPLGPTHARTIVGGYTVFTPDDRRDGRLTDRRNAHRPDRGLRQPRPAPELA